MLDDPTVDEEEDALVVIAEASLRLREDRPRGAIRDDDKRKSR